MSAFAKEAGCLGEVDRRLRHLAEFRRSYVTVRFLSPGGGPLDEMSDCFHCGGELGQSPFRVALQTPTQRTTIPVCLSCQRMRQEGQLPVELILQQWYYGQGVRLPPEDLFVEHQIRLTCLGCDAALAKQGNHSEAAGDAKLSSPRRMPDGSTIVLCPSCDRTNVLEGRSGQLVAVRLW